MCEKRAKIGRGLGDVVRKHILLCAIIIVFVLAFFYICFPRNVKKLIYTSDKSTVVEIIKVAGEKTDSQKISLNSEQQKELLELCEKSYVRLKVFHKDYSNSNEMGYLIIVSDNQDTIHFFSSNIISINGTQYQVYGRALSTGFKSIIESGER